MDFGRHLVRGWWVVAALADLAVIGAAFALGSRTETDERTVGFVLRPDASVSNDDLPGTLEALESDGPLVQSVIGVLGSEAMLDLAAASAGVPQGDDYTIEATGRPGTALIDSTLASDPGGPRPAAPEYRAWPATTSRPAIPPTCSLG